jgi:hypothetical protein
MITDLKPLPFVNLYALDLPHNISWIDHPYQVPGSIAIVPVDSIAEAIDTAGGRECGLMQSKINDALYLIIPVEITAVSVVHHGDVLRVEPQS